MSATPTAPAAQTRAWWLPLAVALAGAAIATAGAYWLQSRVNAEADAAFQRGLVRTVEEVTRRFQQPVLGLGGVRGVYATHETVSRETFRDYARSVNLATEFPGVRGFGFVAQVPAADLPAFVARERADGAPGFALRQLGDKSQPDHFVIKHVEPADRNEGALGVDVGSEPVRRRAAMEALHTGEATVSGAITLVQDQRHTPGVLLYLPLFKAGDDDKEPSRRTVRGLLYAPIVLEELLAGLSDVETAQLRVEMIDSASGTAAGSVMFDSAAETAQTAQAAQSADAAATEHVPGFEAMTVVGLPGRLVTLRVRSTAAFDAQVQSRSPALLLAGGLAVSLLLGGLLRQQATGRVRAERLAQAMTTDLGRLALVAQRTINAVVITDVQRRITWVNAGFERITGYSAAEALGQSPGRLLQSEATDAATVQRLRQALDERQPFAGEIVNRSKTGRSYWLSMEIQPVHDAAGVHIGFMAVEADITAHKEAEAALRASQSILDRTGRIAGVGGWALDLTTLRMDWTEETFRLHDLPPGHQPSLADCIGFRTPAAQPVYAAAVQRCIDEGVGFDIELPIVTVQGRRRWLRTVGEREQVDGRPPRVVGACQDITARCEMAAALDQKHALLNNIIENLPCGLTVFDADLCLQAGNSELSRLLQLPPHLVQVGQTQFEDIIRFNAERGDYGTLDADALQAHVKVIVERARSPIVAHAFERPGPDGRMLEVRGGPLPGGAFVTTYTDISARCKAEDEARRSSALLRGAIDALDEAFVLYDPDDRLLLCNQRYREIYPVVADLMVPGVKFEDLVRAGAERGEFTAAVGRVDDWVTERVAQHQAANLTVVQPLADGRTLRIVERKLSDGHTVGFRIDISELMESTQRAEQATRDARNALARLQAIYDVLPVGITITDPQGHIIDCNPASERLLGITRAQHLARSHADDSWQILREDGSAMPSEEFASVRALTQRTAVHGALMQVLTPHHHVWLSVNAMPVEHGELGVVVAYVDVTEQRAQQQALLEAKSAAERASLAKSQFLANMSHEIRTPMNAVLGMLALLKKTALSPRQADYTHKTEGAARSLLGLLNDILDFSKVEAGKMTLDPQPFRVDQMLRELGVIVSANVGAKPVEVLFDIDPALPRRLVGDAPRLQQVLINLVGNAVKFTSEGEVVIALRVAQHEGQAVRLGVSVRDTGIGIAPENQARIFSGFTQAEASTTRRFGGTGLGVAISQRLVRLMGGELGLQSALGQGSTFHFEITLPVAADDAGGDATLPASASASAALALRALVVDDNPTARDVLQHMTQALGWVADCAASGEEALALLAERQARGERYDAVFLDWQMPGLDGWETADRLRAAGLADDAPVVVMVTAHGREKLEQRSETERQLLDAYLVKPVTASMLFDAVVDAHLARDLMHPSARVRGPEAVGPGPGSGPGTPALARLTGLRLLVTEDNRNNQQVARELLEDEGALVQIAENGQEGVDAVAAATTPFDAVLMDLQMPVMDGFTATARIRQQLGRTALPIVAMTANAMASDREACLAAGMNEHVGKPFDIDHLVAVLLRLCGRSVALAARPAVEAAAAPARPLPLPLQPLPLPLPLPQALTTAAALAGVDLAAALRRIGGKRPVYTRMLRSFITELRAMPDALAGPLAAGDSAALSRGLHTLKGLAATVGLAELAGRAAQAETALSAGMTATAPIAEAPIVDAARASAPSANTPSASAPTASAAIATSPTETSPTETSPTSAPTLSATALVHETLQAVITVLPALTALCSLLQSAADADAPAAAGLDGAALRHSLLELAGLLESCDMRATDMMAMLRQRAGAMPGMHALDEAVSALDFDGAAALCSDLLSETTP